MCWLGMLRVQEVLGEEVLSEKMSPQEVYEDRAGRPCTDSIW